MDFANGHSYWLGRIVFFYDDFLPIYKFTIAIFNEVQKSALQIGGFENSNRLMILIIIQRSD